VSTQTCQCCAVGLRKGVENQIGFKLQKRPNTSRKSRRRSNDRGFKLSHYESGSVLELRCRLGRQRAVQGMYFFGARQ
jgi:hypothetical protein